MRDTADAQRGVGCRIGITTVDDDARTLSGE
jgi:hypothetical protein